MGSDNFLRSFTAPKQGERPFSRKGPFFFLRDIGGWSDVLTVPSLTNRHFLLKKSLISNQVEKKRVMNNDERVTCPLIESERCC